MCVSLQATVRPRRGFTRNCNSADWFVIQCDQLLSTHAKGRRCRLDLAGHSGCRSVHGPPRRSRFSEHPPPPRRLLAFSAIQLTVGSVEPPKSTGGLGRSIQDHIASSAAGAFQSRGGPFTRTESCGHSPQCRSLRARSAKDLSQLSQQARIDHFVAAGRSANVPRSYEDFEAGDAAGRRNRQRLPNSRISFRPGQVSSVL